VLRQAGLFACWTPDQFVDWAGKLEDKTSIGLQPLLGGLSPEVGWKSLRLLEAIMPRVRAAIAGGAA